MNVIWTLEDIFRQTGYAADKDTTERGLKIHTRGISTNRD